MPTNMYHITPDTAASDYDIDAAHTVSLPGVVCPQCGTWARTGVAYPTVTKSMLVPLLPRLCGVPLPVQNFQKLQSELVDLIGAARPLFPGSKFGVAVGRVTGMVPDLAWSNPWTLFAQRCVFDNLQARGLNLTGAVADLKSTETESPELVEIEAVPRVHLHRTIIAQQGAQECVLCGRMGIRKPPMIILDRESLDPTISIQRIYELASLIVNAEFAELIRNEQLRGVKLLPVESA